MYLWAQAQLMPTTPGLHWTKEGHWFKKSIMISQTSFEATQYLYWLQTTINVQLEHAYFHGEFEIEGYKVDGYAKIDGVDHFYEYLGCYHHPGCCISDSSIPDAAKKRSVWEFKSQFLRSQGVLHVMRGCEWKQLLRSMEPPKTQMSNILVRDDEKSLLEEIRKGEIYGFAVCDVTTPVELIKKMGNFMFPPIIDRKDITEDMLSPYMKQRLLETDRKPPKSAIVQVYNGKQILVLSSLLQFYMEQGMVVSNVTKFIQYIGAPVLEPFTKKVVELRVQATHEKDAAKSLTAKLMGNSGKIQFDLYVKLNNF